MSTTTAQPAPAGEIPATLAAAKAAFQARLPRITKGKTAKVEHKGGGSHSYDYADLADVNGAVLPLLGSLGLSFTARPTVNGNGQFVLAYKLEHASGEAEEGEWPLPSPVSVGPQIIGGAITYARRYSLQAVTGVQPDGEDDDAGAAQQAGAYANPGDAWAAATPAPRRDDNGRPMNQGPRGQDAPAREPGPEDLDPDAQEFADEAYEALTIRGLEDTKRRAREAGKLAAWIRSPGNGKIRGLGQLIAWKRVQLEEIEAAHAALHDAAAKAGVSEHDLGEQVRAATGKAIDDCTAAELRHAAQVLAGEKPASAPPPAGPVKSGEDNAVWLAEWNASFEATVSAMALDGLRARIGPAIANRTITPATGSELAGRVAARKREMQGAAV